MSYNPLYVGAQTTALSYGSTSGYQNGTGSTMSIATVVSASSTSGQMVLTDVTNETTVEAFLGLTGGSIPSAATGQVVSDGRLQNIPSSLGFSVGDPLWVGLTPGSLTNVKPDLTVEGWQSGYFVIFMGVVVANEFDPSNQDIQIFKQIIGEL